MAIKLPMGSGVQQIFYGGGNAMEQKLGQKYTSEMSLITVNEHITDRFPNKHIPCYIVHLLLIIFQFFFTHRTTQCVLISQRYSLFRLKV